MHAGIVFDLDNTLCPCDPAYAEAQARFVKVVQRIFPDLGEKQILSRFSLIDRLAAEKGDFSQDRFPNSMVRTLQAIAKDRGHEVKSSEVDEAYTAGRYVFDEYEYEPYPGVIDTLEAYMAAGIPMALCTKGDPEIQMTRKIAKYGLDRYFPGRIEITVNHKGADEIAKAASRLRLPAEADIYMVGDSMRDDILGGQKAGLLTVLIDGRFYAWNFNKTSEDVTPDHVISELPELLDIIPAIPLPV